MDQQDAAVETVRPEALERARQLIEAGDLPGSEAILADIISAGNAPANAHGLYSRALYLLGKREQALTAARTGVEAYPDHWRLRARLIQTMIKLDRSRDAEKELSKAHEDFPDNAAVHALDAEAKLMTLDMKGAQKCIGRARELAPEDPDHAALEIVIADARGDHAQAAKLLTALPKDQRGSLSGIYRDVVVRLSARGREEDALALGQRACALLPDAVGLRIMCAERLLVAKRGQEALALLEDNAATEMPQDAAFRFHRAKGRALYLLKDHARAIPAFENALAMRPDDEQTLRDLYVLNQKAGRVAEMRSYGLRLSSAGAKRLPETLAAGFEQIRERKSAVKPPEEKLEWAWEIADKARWDRSEWLAAVEWGMQADALMRAWWLNVPEHSAEIGALIDRPTQTPLDALPAGARCLCVGSHLGSMAGGVHFLETCGRPFRGFGFAGPDPVRGDRPPMRIASNGNSAAALRSLIDEIQKGTLIGFAADSPAAEDGLPFEFLGREITLSTFVPRLMHKQRAAGLWWQALWQGDRIRIELERLPDPDEDEPMEEWCRRWCAAYLSKIERVMRGDPRNLVLNHGIWRNANPKFLRRRRSA